MNQGKYIFSQVVDTVIRYRFNQCVARYKGERRVKNLTCWEQFLSLSFGQLSFRKSLRDIVVCLTAHQDKLYHLGFRAPVRRSTLADAGERRDWRIYRDFAASLIADARKIYAGDTLGTLQISEAVYAIDATTIELCLSLFPWARIPKRQAAIKLNLGLDLRGGIPSFFAFSIGRKADIWYFDQINFEAGSYYVFDRGYHDFQRFSKIDEAGAYFVTRAKKNWAFRRLYSNPTDETTGVRCDQIVVDGHPSWARKYPGQMRRIKYYDAVSKRYYVFMTNNFTLPAATIAELYRQRWQIELFFRWIKQHLSVESFWGRSPNAVKTQICVAIATYLLIAILKKRLRIERSTYEILQILSVSLFNKIPIVELISNCALQIAEPQSLKQAQLLMY
jgi:hypothetical protein